MVLERNCLFGKGTVWFWKGTEIGFGKKLLPSLFTGQHQGKLDFCSRFKGNRRNPSFLRRKLATFFFIPFFHSSPISQGEKDGPLFFFARTFSFHSAGRPARCKERGVFHFFFASHSIHGGLRADRKEKRFPFALYLGPFFSPKKGPAGPFFSEK